MIEAHGLTKRYGSKTAVDNLSFTVESGKVTGFLGPNGSGKSTTMRLILGLDRPQAGTVTIGGRRYRDLEQPLRAVGSLLEARSAQPSRTARDHLLFLARAQGLPASRADEVLELAGLRDAARERAGKFSLGMGQRLGIAAALLGDPQVLLLDEPVNGLDPEGVLWIRQLMKQFAASGKTVFVSSHLMNEMAVTADDLVVISHGKLIANCPAREFIERNSEAPVLVRTADTERLTQLVTAAGGRVTADDTTGATGTDKAITVSGVSATKIADLAAAAGLALHELTPLASLENAFLEATADGHDQAAPQDQAATQERTAP
jgi:ABC-2 type transport system ATP-binding protein